MEADEQLVAEVLAGDTARFELLVKKYQPRIFATVRRYARRESEVEDIVQEVFIKAFHKLDTFRAEAPFEHWLMRLTTRLCYDFLRRHQRRPVSLFGDLSSGESDWLDRLHSQPAESASDAAAARELVGRLLDCLSPAARLVITLLEIEEKSVKEIAQLTGWSTTLVKVRAFRARKAMRRHLERMLRQRKL